MRKFILISMITLASVSLGACRQNVTIKQDAPGQKAFLTDGQIYDLHSGKIISSSELLADLATAQHLIIGEKHDNAEHHQIELWLIQNLLIQRPQGSVLLEMLTSEQQPRVNQVKCWLKDNPVVRDSRVQELLNWQKGWSWEMYGDIVMQLLRGPYPLLNANIGREQILALYKKNEFPKGKKSTAPVVQEAQRETI
ncbi:TPA: ChaN family lipoprotein, partial [Escherichia coli]